MTVLNRMKYFGFNITMLHAIEKFDAKAIVSIFIADCKAVFGQSE